MNKEKLGALIDGVYAIAMTLLVLELPIPKVGEALIPSIKAVVPAILDYILTFIILFAFWYHQRRINDLIVEHCRLTLWLNAFTLMMVCLIPFAATLLYNLGGENSSLFQLNHSAFADLVFIAICLSVDLSLHLELAVVSRSKFHTRSNQAKVIRIMHSRQITTLIIVLLMFLAFALPGSNRRSLFLIPLLLMFEDEVINIWKWVLKVNR